MKNLEVWLKLINFAVELEESVLTKKREERK